jgi:hypothetical protein
MIIALVAATLIAQAAPAAPPPAPAATAAASAAPASSAPSASDAAVMARAKALLQQLQAGKVDRSQLDDKMNASLTDALVAQISSQLAPLGDPVGFAPQSEQKQDELTVYEYRVDFKTGSLTETYILDSSGKVAGLFFKPVR